MTSFIDDLWLKSIQLKIKVALDNDASCVEALYNLGLCHKQLKRYEESLEIFFKLQSIVRNHPEVMFQIANVYELVEDIDQVG